MDFSLKDLIELIFGFFAGSGISFHLTRQYYTRIHDGSQVQKNSMFSKNNTQIGEIHVRK